MNFPIVGIGASAGGQQPLTEFFQHLPTMPNCAFIVVTHLTPEYESQLAHILSRVSPIPTKRISHRQLIENNHLYVMPEGVLLTVRDGRCILTARTEKVNRAIDHFFVSLAKDQTDRTIGIVLSGAGSDGTIGVNAIHEAGGKAFVQSPSSSEFSSMPRSAIAGDHPDVIGNPAKLAEHICAMVAVP